MKKYNNNTILKTLKMPMTDTAKQENVRMMACLTPEQAVRFADELKKEYKSLLTAGHNLMNGGDLFRVYDNRQKYE